MRTPSPPWPLPPRPPRWFSAAILGPPGGGLGGRMFARVVAAVTVGAADAAVDVELAYPSDALRVRVRDSGPGPVPGRPSGAGHGLLGMRERVATLNGERWTGPVKTHVSRLLGKLGLRDRAQAVVVVYESGLVVPGGDRGES